MPLDPSISLHAGAGLGQTGTQNSLMGIMGQGASVMNALNQNKLFNRTLSARDALGGVISGATDPNTGELSISKFGQGISHNPEAAFLAPDVLKTLAERQKTQFETAKVKAELWKNFTTDIAGTMNALAAKEGVSWGDVTTAASRIATVWGDINIPGMDTRALAIKFLAEAPGQSNQPPSGPVLVDYLRQRGLQAMDLAKQAELVYGKFETAGNVAGFASPYTGNFTPSVQTGTDELTGQPQTRVLRPGGVQTPPGAQMSAPSGGAPGPVSMDSNQSELNPNLVSLVRRRESDNDPNAVSPKNATGLMQVMPDTARDPGFGVTPFKAGVPLNDPAENQRFGTEYLTAMSKRYGGDIEATLVAYNAGPGVADKWIAAGRNPGLLPAETKAYVKSIMSKLGDEPMRGRVGQGGFHPYDQEGPQMAQAQPQVYSGGPTKQRADLLEGKGPVAELRDRWTKTLDSERDFNMRAQELKRLSDKIDTGPGTELGVNVGSVVSGTAKLLASLGKIVNKDIMSNPSVKAAYDKMQGAADQLAGGNLAAAQEFKKYSVISATEALRAALEATGNRIAVLEWQAFQDANINLGTKKEAIDHMLGFAKRQLDRDTARSQLIGDYVKNAKDPNPEDLQARTQQLFESHGWNEGVTPEHANSWATSAIPGVAPGGGAPGAKQFSPPSLDDIFGR